MSAGSPPVTRSLNMGGNMTIRKTVVLAALFVGVVAMLAISTEEAKANRGDGALGVVYVRSQGLYFDTFVAAQKLPPKGPFQLLVDGETEYGPGDRGYVGGRWMVPNDEGGFDYFLCPLLGPGRETP
jgi:hypothetical protein